MNDEPVTLFSLKIKGSRFKRQLFALFKVLTLVFAILAAIGAAQVFLCQQEAPKRTVIECLKG